MADTKIYNILNDVREAKNELLATLLQPGLTESQSELLNKVWDALRDLETQLLPGQVNTITADLSEKAVEVERLFIEVQQNMQEFPKTANAVGKVVCAVARLLQEVSGCIGEVIYGDMLTPRPSPPAIKERKKSISFTGRSNTKAIKYSSAQEQEPDSVVLGVSAPRDVKPGEEFIANFLACLPELEGIVQEIVEKQSHRAVMRPGLEKCQWKKGIRVKVKATAGDFSVVPCEEEFEWDGEYKILPFDIAVPEEAMEGSVLLKFDVVISGFRVARLRAEVTITTGEKTSARVMTTGKPARTAFASYASKDRLRITDRLAALRIHDIGLDVFMDHLSLIPGEKWKERLAKEIEARELFLLFWSPEAKKSKWVKWEWRKAFELRKTMGVPEFEIHPLENGLKPPMELNDLHFGDVFMTIREVACEKQ